MAIIPFSIGRKALYRDSMPQIFGAEFCGSLSAVQMFENLKEEYLVQQVSPIQIS